jgi:hypothetical protein
MFLTLVRKSRQDNSQNFRNYRSWPKRRQSPASASKVSAMIGSTPGTERGMLVIEFQVLSIDPVALICTIDQSIETVKEETFNRHSVSMTFPQHRPNFSVIFGVNPSDDKTIPLFLGSSPSR